MDPFELRPNQPLRIVQPDDPDDYVSDSPSAMGYFPGPRGGGGSIGGLGPNRWIPPGPNGAIGWIGGLGPIGCMPPGPRGCIGCTPPGPRGSTPQFGRSGQTENTDEITK